MIRALTYLVVGWVLIAVVGGLADVFMITVMLPATSVVVLTHIAFSRALPLTLGLALGVAFGYLEDLHQGAPVGTLTLAYALSYLALAWAAERIAIKGWPTRMLSAFVSVVVVDLLTAGILVALAEPLGLRRDALGAALWDARWHCVATALVAPPVWTLFERLFTLLKIEEPPAPDGPRPLGARQ
jgi:cell shape-determining protein MreD